MPLARSASLTISTTAANTPSISTSAGTLFGSTLTPATAPTDKTTTPIANPAMSLFGAAAKPATTGTGLFGSTTPAATTGTTGGGLFGQAASTATPSATTSTTLGTGLFGQPAQTPAAATPTTGTGLFGQPAAAAAKPATGGLFGAATTTTPTTTQPAQTTGGLFGSATTTAQPATQPTGTGLFGQSQAAAKPATGSLFGSTTTTAQQPAQPAQIPAATINLENLRPRTRFDDLAQPVQEQIHLLDKGITRVIKMRDEIDSFMPQHSSDIEQLGRDVAFVESKFRTVQVALNRDIQTVKALQDMTKKNIGDAQLSFKATDNLKLPTHYHQTGLFASTAATTSGNGNGRSVSTKPGGTADDASATHADAQDLITYFNRVCDDVERYKRRLDEYRSEIERDMPGVENGLYEQIRAFRDRQSSRGGGKGDAVADQLGQILGALREMGTAIVSQAGIVADTRERLSRLQAGMVDGGVYGL